VLDPGRRGRRRGLHGQCASGSCDLSLELCNCADDDQCGQGICTDAGKCGPSFCNGYKICSCWGGCVWWHANDVYTPADSCEVSDLYCCEGGYPADPTASGFCSNTMNCGAGECDTSADCTEQVGNVCVVPLCMDDTCFYPAVNAANCASVMDPGETWADQDPPCCCNVDADCPTLPCVDDVFCDIDSSSATYHQCIFGWDPVGASCEGEGLDPFGTDDTCGTWECTGTHECVEVPHNAAACDAANGGPGGANDDCGSFWCQGVNCVETFTAVGGGCPNDQPQPNDDCGTWACNGGGGCVETLPVAGSPCPNDQAHPDDTCGDWGCNGTGSCIEYVHAGVSCDQGHGGPGGLNDQCGIWVCQGNGDCIENTALFDGAACALAPDTECNYGVCEDGACVEHFEVLGTGCNAAANDNCGAWQCNGAGTCIEVTAVFNGNACDAANGGPGGNNDNCGVYQCSNGACLEIVAPFSGAACDAASGGPGGNNDNCGRFFCNGLGGCAEVTAPYANLACDAASGGPGGVNDNCGKFFCNALGACQERTAPYLNAACDAASGGPGGPNDLCGTWACNGAGGCLENTASYNGNLCAGAVGGNPCAIGHCLNGGCPYDLAVGATCVPVPPGSPCSLYQCSAARICANMGPLYNPGMAAALETCNGGAVATPWLGSPVQVDGDNACAIDNYDPYTVGRFASCPTNDSGDAVYNFVDNADTNPANYQLQRTKITIAPMNVASGYSNNTSWEPLLYARLTCGTNTTQYTCNDYCTAAGSGAGATWCTDIATPHSTISTGPWPLQDYPNSGVAGGMTVVSTRGTSVFVDSRSTTVPPGGEFRMRVSKELHSNNDCRNTASFVGAPFVPGGNYWKERWRGNTTGYTNTWNALLGLATGASCWAGAGFTAADPKPAFFRIELPNGATSMGAEIPWDHTYKIYTDHAGISSSLESTLSFWGLAAQPVNDPNGCANELSSQNSCDASGAWRPRERVIRTGENWRNGYVAVANYYTGETGNYELNVVRSPRPYLSMAKIYAGPGNTIGGGCCSPGSHPFATTMDLEGYRMDFVPTNDTVKGYYVASRVPAAGELTNGWLVDPATGVGGNKFEHQVVPTCTGADGNSCKNNTTTVFAQDVGFSVPIAGDYYRYYCINQAGYVALRKNSTDACPAWDAQPRTDKLTRPYTLSPGQAPLLAPLWGNLVPCWKWNRTCAYDPGWSSCELYQYSSCQAGFGAVLTTDLVRFEGTTARVLTFNGLNSALDSRTANNIASINNALQFQVIIRVDGRVTYFYKLPTTANAWDRILDVAGWMIGLSGSRYLPCNTDAQCTAAFGAGVECDNDSYDASGEPIYTAGMHCLKRITNYLDAAQVSGTWVGGP
jgi:hypothetical protein